MGRRDALQGNKFLEGPQQMAMLRAVFPEAALIPQDSSVHTSVNLRSEQLISEVDALVDSGATDNFISPDVTEQFNIPTRTLDKQLAIRNVDGTPNKFGKIDQAADLIFRFKGQTYTQPFYVVDLGKDHILLGMPFLSATNPNIDWARGTLQGKVEASTIKAHRKPLPRQAVESAKMKTMLEESRYRTTLKEFTNEEEEPLMVRRTTKSTTLAADATDETERTWQEQVPTEYHKYGKIFSEEESQRFPGKRPWDHAIDLAPQAPRMQDRT